MQNSTNTEVPVGIKIISIFDFFIGGLQVLIGVLTFALGGVFLSLFYSAAPSSTYLQQVSYIVILGGVLLFLLGGVYIAAGIGLWGGKQWGRITQLILSAIAVLGSLYGLIVGRVFILNISSLLVFGIIFVYLCCAKEVREVF